jgi:hypothetical protein
MRKGPLLETPVMLIFFNRPETLKKVFKAIMKARPGKLFLVQDGPREDHPEDIINIMKCREIVDEIDWTCNVYKNYSRINLSCDHREFTGITWSFKYVDRLIVLEDDCLPSNSFFRFCDETLEKYKDDQRIQMIGGLNHLGEYCLNGDSYFFSQSGVGNGWATWKRVWEKVAEERKFNYLNDKKTSYILDRLLKKAAPKGCSNYLDFAKKVSQIKKETGKISSWELMLGIDMFLQNQLIILPTKNLISNIGLTPESTHGTDDIRKLSGTIQKIFFMKSYEIDFPLTHPEYVIRNIDYEERVTKIRNPNRTVKFFRRVEAFFRKIIFTKKGQRKKLLLHYINKLFQK